MDAIEATTRIIEAYLPRVPAEYLLGNNAETYHGKPEVQGKKLGELFTAIHNEITSVTTPQRDQT